MKRIWLWALILALLFSGCAAKQASDTVFCMDTVMTLTVFGSPASEALETLETELYRLDAALGPGAEENADAQALLTRSRALTKLTDGAFDAELGAVTALWGFGTENARVPDAAELTAALTGEKQTDFGAVGKGFAAARCRELLTAAGVRSALLSLGGNVLAFGEKPDGQAWTVALQDPEDPDTWFGCVQVRDRSVVTSGGYQRFFEADGVRYHHILDPETGFPAASGLLSVTVVSRDDTLADALSTALFVMGLEEGCRFWRQNAALFDAVFLTQDRTILVTAGLADCFTCEGSFEVIGP